MIRSFNHGSYPRVGESPLDQQMRRILDRRERGAVPDGAVQEVADEVTTVVVAEQSRAFIDVVSDGMVRWSGPHSHLAAHLAGLETRGLRRWFETNFYDRQVVVVGEIRRRGPFLVRDFEVAKGVTQKPVKATLPGPATFARLAVDEHYGSLDGMADALAAALAQEVAALAAAGMRFFQLDEPLLCRHPEDLERVSRTAGRVFAAAGGGATTILSTYYGDLTAVAGSLARLPGTHLGLEVVAGSPNAGLLARLPEGKGVALGLFDARTTLQEDAREVAERLLVQRESLTARDVLVGPNAGLDLLPRDVAFDKLLQARYLVEQLSREWTWAC
jgi:5-methyltetrahydropteroyltriglutamate--homocysteine methyltransferase